MAVDLTLVPGLSSVAPHLIRNSLQMIKINEIFYSIQGETSYVGYPTVFVRTSGCNLRCTYCDTTYAYYSGQMMSESDIIAEIRKHPNGQSLGLPEGHGKNLSRWRRRILTRLDDHAVALAACFFNSHFATASRCTSSGPSASLRVRELAHAAAHSKSWQTPAPPCA